MALLDDDYLTSIDNYLQALRHETDAVVRRWELARHDLARLREYTTQLETRLGETLQHHADRKLADHHPLLREYSRIRRCRKGGKWGRVA